ncbi:MAG: alkaline phosphatase family protein [Anaerolineales bacterium]|nr:alkaline phosphatase family protein [Anaerolineales bacterium]
MNKKPKVLVIGLDGVPLSLIKRFVKSGGMPFFSRLLRDGAVGDLQSTIPPTSGPAWTAFQTGNNPAKTNIFDFIYRQPGTYAFSPVSTVRRAGPTLWQLASQAGKRVGVMNMPMTYPVEPVNGYIISGFMTPATAKDYGPADLLAELKREAGKYHIYPSVTYSPGHHDKFITHCRRLLDHRTRCALYLMEQHPVDLMAVVFFDTDRILHQLWHLLDPSHPWRSDREDLSAPVEGYFRHLDDSVRQLVEAAGNNTLVMILSDHGMGAAHQFIVLNNWLMQVGLLKLENTAWTRTRQWLFNHNFNLRNVHKTIWKMGLAHHAEYSLGYFAERLVNRLFLSFRDVDWSRTMAYSYGRHLGSIYLNVKNREPHGIINPGREYEQIREQIIQLSQEMVDPASGRPVIGRVLRREEIYHGPYLDQAPDLILYPAAETDIFFGLADFGYNRTIDTIYRYSGMHREKGLLILSGKGVQTGTLINGARIIDMAPTILYALGLGVPPEMDGRVLKSALAVMSRQVDYQAVTDTTAGQKRADGYTRREENEIIRHLKDLNYFG